MAVFHKLSHAASWKPDVIVVNNYIHGIGLFLNNSNTFSGQGKELIVQNILTLIFLQNCFSASLHNVQDVIRLCCGAFIFIATYILQPLCLCILFSFIADNNPFISMRVSWYYAFMSSTGWRVNDVSICTQEGKKFVEIQKRKEIEL